MSVRMRVRERASLSEIKGGKDAKEERDLGLERRREGWREEESERWERKIHNWIHLQTSIAEKKTCCFRRCYGALPKFGGSGPYFFQFSLLNYQTINLEHFVTPTILSWHHLRGAGGSCVNTTSYISQMYKFPSDFLGLYWLSYGGLGESPSTFRFQSNCRPIVWHRANLKEHLRLP